MTAKVRAERHLVHVMCAERRLLLQLFPRHVLQHVVEDNPLLQLTAAAGPGGLGAGVLGGGAAGGGSPLEALPAEWLAGDDWRPVLRDADKLATLHPMVRYRTQRKSTMTHALMVFGAAMVLFVDLSWRQAHGCKGVMPVSYLHTSPSLHRNISCLRLLCCLPTSATSTTSSWSWRRSVC